MDAILKLHLLLGPLSQKGVDLRHFSDGLIDLRVASLDIGPDVDQIFRLLVDSQ
jgi:hypothetical protein